MLAVGLHSFTINPNPFAYVVKLLLGFGIISGLIEAVFWAPREPVFRKPMRETVLAKSIWAHMIGVPIALVILFSPYRPYVGLSRLVAGRRLMSLHSVMKELEKRVFENQPVPNIVSVEDLIKRFAPEQVKSEPDYWVLGYVPDYARFDSSEKKRKPWEWNNQASGLRISESGSDDRSSSTIWLLRSKSEGRAHGFVLYRYTGAIATTSHTKELGFVVDGKRP